jgi:hypothetical protein
MYHSANERSCLGAAGVVGIFQLTLSLGEASAARRLMMALINRATCSPSLSQSGGKEKGRVPKTFNSMLDISRASENKCSRQKAGIDTEHATLSH